MSRRIALAILLTVWAILVAGCITAYITVRWAMIQQLDRALLARASALPELNPSSTPATRATRAPATLNTTTSGQGDRYVIKTRSGVPISPAGGGKAAPGVELLSAAFVNQPDGTRLRVLTIAAQYRLDGSELIPVTLTYQSSADQLDSLLNRLAWIFLLFGVAAGLLSAWIASVVSRVALRPLRETAEIIGGISPQHLHLRIDPAKLPPELLPMAHRLNEMLQRIEQAYKQRQQFLADASHELRTPVAALVTTTEVSLRRPRDADAYRQTLQSTLADARLMQDLVERLMEQCRAEEFSHDEPVEPIDVANVCRRCASQAQALGTARSIQVLQQIPDTLLAVTQIQRLRSVITNLMSNAVEYNRENGIIEISVKRTDDAVELVVRDTGIGIDPEHLPFVFDPFFRIDRSRSHVQGHLGLGLSLVHAHVKAVGGKIEIESKKDVGTTFKVHWPIDPVENPTNELGID